MGWGSAQGLVPGYGPPMYGAYGASPQVQPSAEQELEMLKVEAQQFEAALKGIRKRIEAMESE